MQAKGAATSPHSFNTRWDIAHNWARVVFLVTSLLGIAGMMFEIGDVFRNWWPSALVNIVQTMMTLIALYLLFSSPGSHWYRKQS